MMIYSHLTQADYKMEKLLLLMVLVSTCCAKPQDLSGKVFVFPKETNSDHVKLQTSTAGLQSFTVCLRFLTDLKRSYAVFSMATPTHDNDLVFYKPNNADDSLMRIHVQDAATDFQSLSFPGNTWHSICATWSSVNGVAQLWLDGKPTIKRFITASPISGQPISILGQEQDSYGGGFDASQSFVGMISKVHMWDHVLSTAEIDRYMNGNYFTPGNVINWNALEYNIVGLVLVEDDPENV